MMSAWRSMPLLHAVGVLATVAIGLMAFTTELEAQEKPGRVRGVSRPRLSGGPAAMIAPNPYVNPYRNPFLNPYATQQQPMDRESLLLYFLSAQRATGGIGSGRLSGLYNSPAVMGRGRDGATGRPPAEMPRASLIPGAGAAGFFGRGISPNRGPTPYYQRHNHYFLSNGH